MRHFCGGAFPVAFSPVSYPDDKMACYALLLEQAAALMENIGHPLTNMANISALLISALPEINWCGFYLMHEGALQLGPFCGLPACVRIPLGHGVCGTAAEQDAVLRVEDVHAFPGHIACDSASLSEIVVPLHHHERVIGVLDIDSPRLSRFDEMDEQMLRKLVSLMETYSDLSSARYTL